MSIQSLAQLIGILTAIVYAIRWLLSFYFKKANDLETARAQLRATSEQAVASNITDLRTAVTVFRQELNDLKIKMAEYAGQLRENGRTMELFQKQWERTTERLEERYQSLEGSEVIKIKDNTFIFKTRPRAK